MNRRRFFTNTAAALAAISVPALAGGHRPVSDRELLWASWVSIGVRRATNPLLPKYVYYAVSLMPNGKEWEYSRHYDRDDLSDDEIDAFLRDAGCERRAHHLVSYRLGL